MIHVTVNGIFITQTQASGIILKEREGKRTLPIVIGEYEAQSIALALENLKPPRPITHDLAINLLETLGATMDSIIISDLRDNTYFAIIRLDFGGEILEVDSRPSDAIALAVRQGIDIYVEESVMDQASYIPEDDEETDKNYLVRNQTSEIDQLKEDLKKAVDAEDYEKAAELRDKIRRLESGS
ncbi:MAG: hypothetical protein GF313_12925 [Caldithrix sp.]|nr:hypothetical protein [Caldithrix sp.]